MNTATLISDWGLTDPYIGIFKGKLWEKQPDFRIIDLTHHIKLGSLNQTAFLLKTAFSCFPEHSYHFILTATSLPSEKNPVLLEYQNHYFITDNNGILYLMFEDNYSDNHLFTLKSFEARSFTEKMIEITTVWAQEGKTSKRFEQTFSNIKKKLPYASYNPVTHTLTTQVLYIDHFENIVCNLTKDYFEQMAQNRPFSVNIKNIGNCEGITGYYIAKGVNIVALFNELDYFEMGFTNSNLSGLANIGLNDVIEIVFHE